MGLLTLIYRLASVQEIRITKNIHFNTINENSSLIESHDKNQISSETGVILSRAFDQTGIIEAVS